MRKLNEITIKEDVRIGDIILEKGDKIKVLKEAGAEFSNELKISPEDAKKIAKNYPGTWDKTDKAAWILSSKKNDHIMTYIPSKGLIFSDFPAQKIEDIITNK